jgi:tetratricopeptide (TPR) repeat protein
MKILLSLFVIFCIMSVGYTKVSDELSPDKRKAFSNDWLETGKAYQSAKKFSKAKDCYIYSIDFYPMGGSAEEARKILNDSFKLNLTYETNKVFSAFEKRGDSTEKPEYKLNNYLMALEVRDDKIVFQKTALVYNKLGNKEKTAEYMKKAIDAGLKPEETDPGLKDISK